jgi:hypothetical protein
MSGHAEWKRVVLPHAGGIGDQDSRLMHSLEECARVSNEILVEDRKRAEKERKRQAAKEQAERKRHGG